MPNAVSAGIAVGSITRQTMPNSEMPSMRAASIRSSGTVLKNCRIRIDAERRDRERHDQRRIAVENAELVKQQEHRDRGRLRRNQDAEQHQREQHLAAGESQLGQRVGGGKGDQHLQREDRYRDHDAVEQEPPQVGLAERGDKIVPQREGVRDEVDVAS